MLNLNIDTAHLVCRWIRCCCQKTLISVQYPMVDCTEC